MKKQNRGDIIISDSSDGVTKDCSARLYPLSIAGVAHITKVVAVELREPGIRGKCISPCSIVTPSF